MIDGESRGDLYIVWSGTAEVGGAPAGRSVPLGTVTRGELFGDLSAVSGLPSPAVRVVALTDLVVLGLGAAVLREFFDRHPESRDAIEKATEDIVIALFLKSVASPFRTLDLESCRRMAHSLNRVSFGAGEVIVRQGDVGDCCYLVRAGSVEVVTSGAEGEERRLAVLAPGGIFGEVALLTEEKRNATVRALESSVLLVLYRQDVLSAIGSDREVGRQFLDMVAWRARPRRARDVLIHQVTDESGATVTVLKRPAQHTYYRLSPLGWFVFQRLDGHRQLRDLTLECINEFKTFAPSAIQEILRGLAEAGFVQGLIAEDAALVHGGQGRRPWRAFLNVARRVTQAEVSFFNVDPLFTAAYTKLFWLFFTLPAFGLIAAIAAVGAVAFVLRTGAASAAIDVVGLEVLLFLVPAQFLAVLVHEAAHAFAVKRFRREVWRVGFGWYWFGPMAFVDTSDMWLAGRWPRLATSFAGPCGDLLTGGVFGIIAGLSSDPLLTAASWQVAFSCFLVFFLNLNPLLEYDGYYALSDLLDRPNLRQEALSWLGETLRSPSRRRAEGHIVDALFSLGSCAFIVMMAAVTFVSYRVFGERLMDHVLPGQAASALAFVIPGAVSLAAGATLVGDILETRGDRDEGYRRLTVQ